MTTTNNKALSLACMFTAGTGFGAFIIAMKEGYDGALYWIIFSLIMIANAIAYLNTKTNE